MKKIRKIIIAVLILVIIGCVGYIVNYVSTQNKNQQVYDELKDKAVKKPKPKPQEKQESQVEIPIDFAALQAENPDIYAWIQIEGTNIAYPVVQSATDNSYYLNYTVDHQYGLPGSIYTENWNAKDFSDYNTVIYGHDMLDGSMFENLHNYSDPQFMNGHPEVIIYTPEKKLTYQIFAAVVYEDKHILYSYDFTEKSQRQSYLDSIFDARNMGNVYRDDVSVTADDRLLTLSTCIGSQPDKRFLVEAVLVSEEE